MLYFSKIHQVGEINRPLTPPYVPFGIRRFNSKLNMCCLLVVVRNGAAANTGKVFAAAPFILVTCLNNFNVRLVIFYYLQRLFGGFKEHCAGSSALILKYGIIDVGIIH